jgi:uncharacterized protein (TIGR02452 family)
MQERIDGLLSMACFHGESNLVLGAFGCGVFANDPREVAELFGEALRSDKYRHRFRKVVFAVLDDANVPPFLKLGQ